MNEILLQKIEQKIQETISKKHELKQLAESLSLLDDSKSFVLGIVVGRLYNAFYYQTKRIFDRDPTESEFQEFVKLIKSKTHVLENLW